MGSEARREAGLMAHVYGAAIVAVLVTAGWLFPEGVPLVRTLWILALTCGVVVAVDFVEWQISGGRDDA